MAAIRSPAHVDEVDDGRPLPCAPLADVVHLLDVDLPRSVKKKTKLCVDSMKS